MNDVVKPELSRKNQYWIPKHRYYELKHFVMQYPMWQELAKDISKDGYVRSSVISYNDKTPKSIIESLVLKSLEYQNNIELIDRVSRLVDPIIGKSIKIAIINGYSFDIIRLREAVPCCKDTYYDLYRRFFWILDKERK